MKIKFMHFAMVLVMFVSARVLAVNDLLSSWNNGTPMHPQLNERVCGIPLKGMTGRCGKLKFEICGGGLVWLTVPGVDLIDPKEAQSIGIQKHTDRRPIFAFADASLNMDRMAVACDDGQPDQIDVRGAARRT